VACPTGPHPAGEGIEQRNSGVESHPLIAARATKARQPDVVSPPTVHAEVAFVPPVQDTALPYRILKYARLGRRTVSPDLAGVRTWDRAVTVARSIDEWVAALREQAGVRSRPDMELRQWALAHMECQHTTAVVESAVRAAAARLNEPWTSGLVLKTSTLDTQKYWNPSDRERFALDYQFLESTIR